MRGHLLGLLATGMLADCASAPQMSASTALVGQPLSTAAEAIGYLPDHRERLGDGAVYVWRLGRAQSANRPATAEFTAPSIPRACTVRITTDAAHRVRDVAYEDKGGRCAEVSRRLRAAAL